MERLEKERQAEVRSYKGLMVPKKMTSNKDIAAKGKTLAELEEDFMWQRCTFFLDLHWELGHAEMKHISVMQFLREKCR